MLLITLSTHFKILFSYYKLCRYRDKYMLLLFNYNKLFIKNDFFILEKEVMGETPTLGLRGLPKKG